MTKSLADRLRESRESFLDGVEAHPGYLRSLIDHPALDEQSKAKAREELERLQEQDAREYLKLKKLGDYVNPRVIGVRHSILERRKARLAWIEERHPTLAQEYEEYIRGKG